ncbi:hypothetical protein [Streptomyces sp. NPDC059460]|uniref:hypothetical protein n=1 Tax=Streptomyces sp. NPDC059460 TaxID=3346840 RepID=UPI00369C0212
MRRTPGAGPPVHLPRGVWTPHGCEARYGRHACVVVDNVVYALLPDASADGGRQRQLVEDITRQATHALRMSARAGLGSTVTGLAYVPRSRDDADHVLRSWTRTVAWPPSRTYDLG